MVGANSGPDSARSGGRRESDPVRSDGGGAVPIRSTLRYLNLAQDKTSATASPLDLLEFPRPAQS